MPTISAKRQITLPKTLCDRLQIEPGDSVDILEHKGRITVIKKSVGRSSGILKHLKADARHSDEDSLRSALSAKAGSLQRRSRRS
jgi:AbrB family looped-hinge helix DNA binding protein